MLPYKIRPLEIKDISQILSIAEPELGYGYVSISLLEKHVKDSMAYVVSTKDEKICGFCLLEITRNTSEIQKIFKSYKPKCVGKIGVIKTIVIQTEYQKKGIGTTILDYCIEFFNSIGITDIYCIAWEHSKTRHINIQRLLLNCHFEVEAVLNDYWEEDSISEGFTCPACESIPCRCRAYIYRRNTNAQGHLSPN